MQTASRRHVAACDRLCDMHSSLSLWPAVVLATHANPSISPRYQPRGGMYADLRAACCCALTNPDEAVIAGAVIPLPLSAP